MRMTDEFAEVRARWKKLSVYQKFEHAVIFILSALIAILVVLAVWTLLLKIFASVRASNFDPTDYSAFQVVFGMIFTVIIALEFERSLLVIAERDRGVVQVRTVILIALLAIVRKLMIMDMSTADTQQLFALAAAVLALGGVYWLLRDQNKREDV